MKRIGVLVLTIVPAVVGGGLLLSSVPGHAEAGHDDTLGFWPEASDTAVGSTGRAVVAQADPRPYPRPPIPPPPPVTPPPPMPPVPPMPGQSVRYRHGKHGMTVSIHDGKVQIDGVADVVQEQLDRVVEVLDNLQDVPPEARERVKARVRAVRDKLHARLSRLRSLDISQIGPEMERMGDEIEKEMEGLDKDLAQFGDKFGSKFGKDFAKFGKDFAKSFGPHSAPTAHDDSSDDSDDGDDDDDDDSAAAVPMPPGDSDASDSDTPQLGDLKQLALDPGQRAQLIKLREDSDRKVADAKRELDELSSQLHDALNDGSASERDIASKIDQISRREADIRKARVLAWVRARSLLRQDQRARIEAVKKSH